MCKIRKMHISMSTSILVVTYLNDNIYLEYYIFAFSITGNTLHTECGLLCFKLSVKWFLINYFSELEM